MFYWDDSLLTGIKEIDNEHFELCVRANKLFEAFVEGKIIEEINSSMEFFEEYIHEHLKNEEELIIKINYPKYKEHKAKHDAFKANFMQLKEYINSKGMTYNFIQKFNYTVIDWLTFHLREDDAAIASYIKSINYTIQ